MTAEVRSHVGFGCWWKGSGYDMGVSAQRVPVPVLSDSTQPPFRSSPASRTLPYTSKYGVPVLFNSFKVISPLALAAASLLPEYMSFSRSLSRMCLRPLYLFLRLQRTTS
jgi:hypothetical protein